MRSLERLELSLRFRPVDDFTRRCHRAEELAYLSFRLNESIFCRRQQGNQRPPIHAC
jgi:hypothetical protein